MVRGKYNKNIIEFMAKMKPSKDQESRPMMKRCSDLTTRDLFRWDHLEVILPQTTFVGFRCMVLRGPSGTSSFNDRRPQLNSLSQFFTLP